MLPRLQERYRSEIAPKIMEKFGYENLMEAPRLVKIIVNVGFGEAAQDKKKLEGVMQGLALITGQRPVATTAKKAIAGFKLRKGSPVGCRVTLRRAHMYEFLDRLVNVALPRIRDFRGIPDSSFDGHGNYSFGLTEQAIFPEVDMDKAEVVHGMDIAIVTTAKSRDEGLELLKQFGMPFRQ